MDPEQREVLSGVVKYVISSKNPKDMGQFLRTIGQRFNPGVLFDGLVARQDMSLVGFGKVIYDLNDFDHLETTLRLNVPLAKNIAPNRIAEFTLGLASHLIPGRPSRGSPIREASFPRKILRDEPDLMPEKRLHCLGLL